MSQIRDESSEASEITPGSRDLASYTAAQAGPSKLPGVQRAGLHVTSTLASFFHFRSSSTSWVLRSPRSFPKFGGREGYIRRAIFASFAQCSGEGVYGLSARAQKVSDSAGRHIGFKIGEYVDFLRRQTFFQLHFRRRGFG